MNVKSRPLVLEVRVEASKSTPFDRLMRLGIGVVVTQFPLLLWGLWSLALGADYIAQNSWRYGLEPIQIYVWLLIAAGLFELIAVFVLKKTDQKPRDLIAIVSLVDTGVDSARCFLLGAD
jgi:hypothetical protein